MLAQPYQESGTILLVAIEALRVNFWSPSRKSSRPGLPKDGPGGRALDRSTHLLWRPRETGEVAQWLKIDYRYRYLEGQGTSALRLL